MSTTETAPLERWIWTGRITDLGAMSGACSHCGTGIRYQVEIRSIDTDVTRVIGTTCADRVGLTADDIKRINRRLRNTQKTARWASERAAAWDTNCSTFPGLSEAVEAIEALFGQIQERVAARYAAIDDAEFRNWLTDAAIRAESPITWQDMGYVQDTNRWVLHEWKAERLLTLAASLPTVDQIGVVEPARYLGTVGQKLTVTGVVDRKVILEPYTYNSPAPALIVLVTTEGATVLTKTTAAWRYDVKAGDRISIEGTVKEHSMYRGAPQTVMTRCKAELQATA